MKPLNIKQIKTIYMFVLKYGYDIGVFNYDVCVVKDNIWHIVGENYLCVGNHYEPT